jgi:hypothetical protein
MKNNGTEHDRVTAKEEQDRRAPSTPAAHELTPAQLELVAGGNNNCHNCGWNCCDGHVGFVKR